MGRKRTKRAGFTILEMVLALAILTIVFLKAYEAMSSVTKSTGRETRQAVLEGQARSVLRQIAFSVMAANRETLVPDSETPLSAEDLRYQVNLGVQDGEVVWSDPEEVGFDGMDSEAYWSENPGTESERRVVLSRAVAPFLEGEIPNGMDDNGNGLIDETGLNFVVDRNCVRIRLTLQTETDEGVLITETVGTTVTCRNLPDEAEE